MSEIPSVSGDPLPEGKMSAFSVGQRGALYVGIAMITQGQSDLASAFSPDAQTRVKFWLGVCLTGFITWRAFIDHSPSQKI